MTEALGLLLGPENTGKKPPFYFTAGVGAKEVLGAKFTADRLEFRNLPVLRPSIPHILAAMRNSTKHIGQQMQHKRGRPTRGQ